MFNDLDPVSWSSIAKGSPRAQRARASTICNTVRRLASDRKGQVSQAGADKITMIVTGTIRMKGPSGEGSALMACPSGLIPAVLITILAGMFRGVFFKTTRRHR
jgi:hypothetical protein